MCEGYMGLNPLVIEQMHIDQIILLICDKKQLEGKPRTFKGTPQELYARGLLDELPEKSYVQQLREKIERDKAEKEKVAKRRKDRRERRKARREQASE
jgi:hypothetical protein